MQSFKHSSITAGVKGKSLGSQALRPRPDAWWAQPCAIDKIFKLSSGIYIQLPRSLRDDLEVERLQGPLSHHQ